MNRLVVVILAVVCSIPGWSQKIPLINSGEVLEKGKALYDSGKYEAAANLYLTIPKRDTNYVDMLAELAITYNAMKQPKKTLEVCEEALKIKTDKRAHLLKSRAVAADYNDEYDKSIEYFTKAQEEYPFDYSLIFNMGVTAYNHQDYEKAEACFFKTLSINPFHARSHLNLASLSMSRGRKTHAMLSMGIYLALAPSDNNRLVTLNKFVNNELSDEGKVPASGANGCEKLDQIIRARIAMDKGFKSNMPLNAPVVRQYEMLFQQLSSISTGTDDPWVKYYLPIYKELSEQKHAEAFLYNAVSSSNNDDIKKWIKKNQDALNAFYRAGNVALKKNREYPEIPASLGFEGKVRAWYNDEKTRYLEAIGNLVKDDVRQGRWIYYYSNGEKSAVGKYDDNGKKIGSWTYFYGNGNVKTIEVLETGEVTRFRENGTKYEHFFENDNGLTGLAEVYFPCGVLKDKIMFKDGKRNGHSETFYPNGKIDVTYNYIDNKVEGESLSYYDDGTLYSKTLFINDLRNGVYVQYHANGQLRMTGIYKDGKGDGEWKYYYQNGVPMKHGKFVNDEYVGDWLFYDKNGELEEKRSYNAEGKEEGENVLYHNGKKYVVVVSRSGIIVQFEYFDQEGKSLGKYGNDKGNFKVEFFYPTGELKGKGQLKNGKRDGNWKFFYRSGGVSGDYQYVDGKMQGVATDYFRNGAKKVVSNWVDDERHGYYEEFYIHGQLQREGWYQEGKREQQWKDYFADGTLSVDYYYLNDKLNRESFDYNIDSKLNVAMVYDHGSIVGYDYFDASGKKVSRVRQEGNQSFIETQYNPTSIFMQREFMCGMDFGKIVKKYPDGKPMTLYPIMNDNVHGLYQHFQPHGKISVEGNYINGEKEGLWKGFDVFGEPYYEGYYFDNQQDSMWIYYYPGGLVHSKGDFSKDERHGITTYQAPDGTPGFQKLFEEGDVIAYRMMSGGQWGEWKKHSGNGNFVYTFANGARALEETFNNGLLEGKRTFYYPDGKIFSEYSYKAGDYHGPYSIYYPNGKIREKGAYKFDVRDGVVEYYNPDGTLFRTDNFRMNVNEGKTTFYNKGAVTKEITFWADVPVK